MSITLKISWRAEIWLWIWRSKARALGALIAVDGKKQKELDRIHEGQRPEIIERRQGLPRERQRVHDWDDERSRAEESTRFARAAAREGIVTRENQKSVNERKPQEAKREGGTSNISSGRRSKGEGNCQETAKPKSIRILVQKRNTVKNQGWDIKWKDNQCAE